MTTKKEKSTHGGKREGSGRTPVGTEGVSPIVAFRASAELKAEITKRGGSEWVRQVVVRAIVEDW